MKRPTTFWPHDATGDSEIHGPWGSPRGLYTPWEEMSLDVSDMRLGQHTPKLPESSFEPHRAPPGRERRRYPDTLPEASP